MSYRGVCATRRERHGTKRKYSNIITVGSSNELYVSVKGPWCKGTGLLGHPCLELVDSQSFRRRGCFDGNESCNC